MSNRLNLPHPPDIENENEKISKLRKDESIEPSFAYGSINCTITHFSFFAAAVLSIPHQHKNRLACHPIN
jgi:hypothetical protein